MLHTLWLTILTSIPLALYIGTIPARFDAQSPLRDAVKSILWISLASAGLGITRFLLHRHANIGIHSAIPLMIFAIVTTISPIIRLLHLQLSEPSIRKRPRIMQSWTDFLVFAGFAIVVPWLYVELESAKLLNLCEDKIGTGQIGSAAMILDELLLLQSFSPDIIEMRNRVRRDVEVLEDRLETQSDILLRAETLARLGRFDEALRTIPEIPEERPERWILLGAIRMHQGQMEDSAAAYRQAIDRIDRSGLSGSAKRQALRRCLNAIAYCSSETRDFRTAIEERTKAASIDPSQAWSDQFEIACCNYELGNKSLAILQMERLLPLLPNGYRIAGENNLRHWRSETYHCLTGTFSKPLR